MSCPVCESAKAKRIERLNRRMAYRTASGICKLCTKPSKTATCRTCRVKRAKWAAAARKRAKASAAASAFAAEIAAVQASMREQSAWLIAKYIYLVGQENEEAA